MQNKPQAFDIFQVNVEEIKGVKFLDADGNHYLSFGKKAQELFNSVKEGKAKEGTYTVIEKRNGGFEFTNYADEGIDVIATAKLVDTYSPEARINNFCYSGAYFYDRKWYPITKEELFKIGESVVYKDDHEEFNDPCLVVDTSFKQNRPTRVAIGYAEIKDVTAITYFKPR